MTPDDHHITDHPYLEPAYLLHKHVWGDRHRERLERQLLEEMAELTVSLLHRRRGRPVSKDAMLGEVADVCICLEFLLQAEGTEMCHLDLEVGAKLRALHKKLKDEDAMRDEGV